MMEETKKALAQEALERLEADTTISEVIADTIQEVLEESGIDMGTAYGHQLLLEIAPKFALILY